MVRGPIRKWAPATFRGGPLHGERRDVPAFGPALVCFHVPAAVHWYSHRLGTARSYLYVGETPGEGRRSDPEQLALGGMP